MSRQYNNCAHTPAALAPRQAKGTFFRGQHEVRPAHGLPADGHLQPQGLPGPKATSAANFDSSSGSRDEPFPRWPPSPGQRAPPLPTFTPGSEQSRGPSPRPTGPRSRPTLLRAPHGRGPVSRAHGKCHGGRRSPLAGRRAARALPVLPDSQSPRGLPREAGQAAAQVPLQAPLVEAVLLPHLAGARLHRHPLAAQPAHGPHPPTAPLRY